MANQKQNFKNVTMRDVARLAGVSQPTVSRVLNQTDTTIAVSDETREKVLAAMKELGYRPNAIARSLRTQQVRMIGLMIADISNSFFHPIARAVQDLARLRNYDVLIVNSDHLYENELHFCEAVTRRPLDGVIMVPVHLNSQDLDQFVSLTNIPVAVLGQQIQHPNIDVVYVRDDLAIQEAVTWMINERGYTNIGYVGVSDSNPIGPRRRHGFEDALRHAGLTADPRYMLEGDFTMESGARAARMLLQNNDLPAAMFVANDLMAIGLILALQEAGYVIPDDIAVMGFDNILEAKIVRPTLTTIAQDPRDIGQKLVAALFDRIENPTTVKQKTLESTYELIIRDSA